LEAMEPLIWLFYALLVAGMLLILVGFLVIAFSGLRRGSGEAEAGGVLMIGPLPIIFGSSPEAAKKASLLALLLMLLFFFLVLALRLVGVSTGI